MAFSACKFRLLSGKGMNPRASSCRSPNAGRPLRPGEPAAPEAGWLLRRWAGAADAATKRYQNPAK